MFPDILNTSVLPDLSLSFSWQVRNVIVLFCFVFLTCLQPWDIFFLENFVLSSYSSTQEKTKAEITVTS